MTAPSRDRLPSLTGLRFRAALFVVVHHLFRQVGVVPGISEADARAARTGTRLARAVL